LQKGNALREIGSKIDRIVAAIETAGTTSFCRKPSLRLPGQSPSLPPGRSAS
jgi:hypothetical protein